jgi:hypothetical protein
VLLFHEQRPVLLLLVVTPLEQGLDRRIKSWGAVQHSHHIYSALLQANT